MASPSLVTAADLEDWLGQEFTASTAVRAEAVLQAVSSLIRSTTGRTWVDTSGELEEVPEDVRMVTVQVAARVWNNPDGYVSERLGDYSYQLPSSAVTGMTLTPAERAILGRYRLRGSAGLWSLSTTRDDPASDTEWVPVVGAPPFPWYSSAGYW